MRWTHHSYAVHTVLSTRNNSIIGEKSEIRCMLWEAECYFCFQCFMSNGKDPGLVLTKLFSFLTVYLYSLTACLWFRCVCFSFVVVHGSSAMLKCRHDSPPLNFLLLFSVNLCTSLVTMETNVGVSLVGSTSCFCFC